eukprot:882234-Karenia_brevis.AAC.1
MVQGSFSIGQAIPQKVMAATAGSIGLHPSEKASSLCRIGKAGGTPRLLHAPQTLCSIHF